MKYAIHTRAVRAAVMAGCLIGASQTTHSADAGWSIVPYVGVSVLGDQSPGIAADGIAPGQLDVSVDTGFTSGLSFRYDYSDSRWTSEIGWEFRANDTQFNDASGSELPSGNYASNIFYLNGRYALTEGAALTPWIGGGLSVVQEVDIDSESSAGERSFSDSGAVGIQLLAGLDYNLSDRFYLTGELRFTSFTGLDLSEEAGGDGRVTNIDYQPVTLGVGIGFRF